MVAEPGDGTPSLGGRGARRFVTIREVAKDAGVGIATVSRTLNNSGYVAEDVRRRVLDSAQRLGYQPSERARSMRNLRSMTLGVVLPELANPVFLEFLRGVEEVARGAGYLTVIGDSLRDPARETAILNRMIAERVDGIVVGAMVGDPRQFETVAAQGIAIVPPPGAIGRELDRAWKAAESAATEDMTRRLLDLGHRRVILVSADRGQRPSSRHRRSRTDVIARVMAEAGADLDHVTLPRDYDMAAAARAMAGALARPDPATAYVAAAHPLAPAVLYGLKVAGASVPDDVSFVTYGDSDWAAAYRPGLSAISHDIHAEARQLTEMLLETIQHGDPRSRVTYEARFVERESCGPVPRAS